MNNKVIFFCDPSGLASRTLFINELIRRKRGTSPADALQNPVLYLAPTEQAVREIEYGIVRPKEAQRPERDAVFAGSVFTLRQFKNRLSQTDRTLPRPASRLVRTIVAAEVIRENRMKKRLSPHLAAMPPGELTRYLVRLFSEIYTCGLTAAAGEGVLARRLPPDRLLLFNDYETRLKDRGFIDPAALFMRLAGHCDTGDITHPVLEETTLLALENPVEITEPEGVLLGALARHVLGKSEGEVWISLPLLRPAGSEAAEESALDEYFHQLGKTIIERYIKADPRQVSWRRLDLPPDIGSNRYETARAVLSHAVRPSLPPEETEGAGLTAAHAIKTRQFESHYDEVEYLVGTVKTMLASIPDLNPDDLVIVTPSGTDYVTLLRTAAERYGVPLNLPESPPFAETRPAEALLRLLRMRLTGYRRDDVCNFLRYLPAEIAGKIGPFDREVRAAGITGGGGAAGRRAWEREWMEPLRRHRDRLESSRNDLTPREESDLARLEARIKYTDEGTAVLWSVFNLADTLTAVMKPSEFARKLMAIAEGKIPAGCQAVRINPLLIIPSDPEAGIVRQRIRTLPMQLVSGERQAEQTLRILLGRIVESFEDFGDHTVDLATLYTALLESCRDQRLPARSRPGSVPVLHLGNHYGTRAEYIFMCGLSSSNFPRRKRFPFLSAMIDSGTNDGRIENRDMWHQARATMLWALCSGRAGVFLTCAASPETGDLPSLFMAKLTALWPAKKEYAFPPAPARGKRYLIELGRALSAQPQEPVSNLPEELKAVMADKLCLHHARRLPTPNRFDGLVPASGEPGAGFQLNRAFSASQFEDLARCPFHFFAARVLGLQPEEEDDDEITPLTRGSIVHEILNRFYTKRLKEAGARLGAGGEVILDEKFWSLGPSVKVTAENLSRAQAELEKIAREVVQRQSLLQPGPFWQRELDNLLQGLEQAAGKEVSPVASGRRPGILQCFLIDELRQPEEAIPAYFELPFRLDCERQPGETAIPIKGRIDRIDVVRNGSFVVLDYKTGEPPDPNDIDKGLLFQLPLYVLGAWHILNDSGPDPEFEAVGAGYLRLKAIKPEKNGRTHFLSVHPDDNTKLRLHHTAREARKGIRSREEFDETIARGYDFAVQAARKIRSGDFHPTLQQNTGGDILPRFCVHYCPYRTICRVSVGHRRMVLETLIRERGTVPVNPNIEPGATGKEIAHD